MKKRTAETAPRRLPTRRARALRRRRAMATAALIVSLRLLNAILVTTQLDPDEWWQAPEVAHRLVFGCGVLTWEW